MEPNQTKPNRYELLDNKQSPLISTAINYVVWK